jgi:hypothetical protein
VKVRIDYTDGHFSMMKMDPDSPHEGMYITEELWARYEAHVKDCQFWSEIIRAFDNVVYLERLRDKMEG